MRTGHPLRSCLVESLPAGATSVLFCVEDNPAACHRSLVAERLHVAHGVAVRHLRP